MPLVLDGTNGVSGNSGAIVSGTAVTASGTSVDFTSIPSWVKRITVMFGGVSLSGTSSVLVQIGTSSGIESTGYTSTSTGTSATSGSTVSSTAGFIVRITLATITSSGHMILTLSGSNQWIESHSAKNDVNSCSFGGGDKTLSGTLDRVRITTVNGTDTFDAGTINIIYE